jgi:fructose-1,6-bisphosphatase/inositol monophosphatase family enzyme
MQVAASAPPEEASGLIGRQYFPKNFRSFIDEFKERVKEIKTLGCAGHEYLRLAGGQADFAVYNRMRPWDHLPGALAVREAGGMVVKWDGTPYMPGDEFGVITVSSNQTLTNYIHDNLVQKMVEEYAKTKEPHRHPEQM